MLVKIAPLGERVIEVNVLDGTTIGKALEIGNININGRDIRINNAEADENTPIEVEGSIIILTQRMKGGKVA
jgi:hypothetical protein